MKLRNTIAAGIMSILVAGTVLAGAADPASAAGYGVPSAGCTSHYSYNHYTQRTGLERQVTFVPNVDYDWYFSNGYHSEAVAYSATLMRHNGSRWVPYRNIVVNGAESFNTSSIGGQSRSVYHSGSYAWQVVYVYRPIGSNTWYQLGWNWSTSCHLN